MFIIVTIMREKPCYIFSRLFELIVTALFSVEVGESRVLESFAAFRTLDALFTRNEHCLGLELTRRVLL